ncbi:MAG: Asp-tRNA(Asn)/Glu-tRNA(Gln) amidotransferase subunit GatA [Minisyncoccota bacterium]
MDLKNLTIKKARSMLDSKEITAVQLTTFYLEEIEKKNKDLNVYLEVYDDVLFQAEEADKRIQKGESTPLLGIPLAIKDNILIKKRKATSASKILEGYVAPYDATAILKLKSQGAVFLGRVNMDEFAMGGSTENSAFGVTKNPIDISRVAGGSSGGSAVAVSAHLALGALGSDTGGSVRQPASFCGVVGFKPTYGSISRHGLMAMGSSLDIIGPITKTVSDAETMFEVMKGKDIYDGTTVDEDTYPKVLDKDKLTIGIPQDLLNQDGIDEMVKENFKQSIEKFKTLGYSIVDVSLPHMSLSLAVYYILMPAEVSSNLARFDGVKYGLHVDGKDLLEDYMKTRGQGFGAEVRRRILLGTYVLSAGYYDSFYGKAQVVRTLIQEEFKKVFESVDLILTPTTPAPAWKIGEKEDPLSAYLADVFTVTANIAGIPAISVPSGVSYVEGKDLPLGIQLMATHMGEKYLFKAGKEFLGE